MLGERFCRMVAGGEDPRFLSPNVKAQYAEDRAFLPVHVDLKLKVDVKKKHVHGIATTKVELFPNAKEMVFRAHDMKILNVKVNGKAHKFEYDKTTLRIPTMHMKEKGSVEIAYEFSNPPLGVFFIHPTKDRPDKPMQAWTHSEANEAPHWYPCQDLPETKCPITMHLTVEEPFMGIANGNLTSTKKSGDWVTYTWDFTHPNPSYLNAFMIGEFSALKDKWKHVDTTAYVQKGREEEGKRAFKNTSKCLAFFSEYTGYEYEHKKYAQIAVADFIYGGMEHTTCTTMTDLMLQDAIAHKEYEYMPERLVSHELAHQWFGDLVTCKDWSHAWLNEGFATFFEMLWHEHKNQDEGRYVLYQDMQGYLTEDKTRYRRPIVSNLYTNPSYLFDRHLYEKGGVFLNYLRYYVGEDAFRATIKHYLHKHAHSAVRTEDLMNAFREVTGKNVNKLFDQWVFSAGYPELKISIHTKGKKAFVRVVQTLKGSENDLYTFDVSIAVHHGKGKVHTERVKIHQKEHRFEFSVEGKIQNVVWDSEYVVLENGIITKPREMWHYQAKHDPHILHRMDAAKELALMAGPEEMDTLQEVLEKDAFWGVRAEAALAIGLIPNTYAGEMLIHASEKESNTRVLRNIFSGLANHSLPEARETLLRGAQRTDSYLAPMAAYIALGKHKCPENWDILVEGLKRDSWMDVIRSGSVMGIAQFQDAKALKVLKSMLHPRVKNETRQTVLRALEIGGKGMEGARALIELGLKDPYINLQIDAVAMLGKIGDERDLSTLTKFQKGHRDGRLMRAALEAQRTINGGIDLPEWKKEKKKS